MVVTYASARTIGPCLASLRDEARRVPLETVVVDNASPDDTLERVRSAFPEVRVVAEPENRGFAAAANAGSAPGHAPFVLFLNPDAVLRPGSVETLARSLEREAGAAAAGPRIVDAKGVAELSFGSFPNPMTELRQKVLGRLHDRRFPPVESWVRRRHARPSRPDWLSGACLLVRRHDLELAGGFDEGYFLYFEDVALCARLRDRGRDVLYVPTAEAAHIRGVSAAHDPERVRHAYRRSQIRWYHTRYGAEMASLVAAYQDAARLFR